jgi:hypothetical protein
MPNLYADVDQLTRTVANGQTLDTTDAIEALRIAEAASRAVDEYCGRTFYAEIVTRALVGRGGRVLDLGGDVLAAPTITVTDPPDGTPVTLTVNSDYVLISDDEDRPYVGPFAYAVIPDWGSPDISAWPVGIGRISLSGATYGYSQRWDSVRSSADAVLTATAADLVTETLTLSAAASPRVAAGTTLRYGPNSEQLYVRVAEAAAVVKVSRAVNGSTGSSGAGGALARFVPEPTVTEAVLLQTRRLWKRKGLAIMPQAQAPGLGAERLIDGLDEDVKFMLRNVRHMKG